MTYRVLTVHQLAEHLIATHLGTLTSSATGDDCNKPSTFVIAPPNTSIASTIHTLLQTRLANRSEKNRVQLLDTIHIMQYLDFAGLAECFSEVSTCLHNLNSGSATLSTSHGRASPQIQRQVLLVDGLCPALESTQRRSGLVQANALSASLLQSITHFSRSYPWLLVLFSLEASGHARGSEELTSAFSSPGKSFCGVSPGGMLQRTLLAGIDTVVLVHDRLDAGLKDGDLVVEVVKDRVGASLGQWVVWPKPG
jgi:hypothetical protein